MKKIIPIAVVLIGLGVYVYFFRVKPSQEYDPVVRGFGTIEATEVAVSSKIPGRIVAIFTDEGARVEKDAPLVSLACEDLETRLEQALVRVEQAKATVGKAKAGQSQAKAVRRQAQAGVSPLLVGKEQAEREYKRALVLIDIDGIPQRTVDQAESAVKTLHEQLEAAREGINVAGRGVDVAKRTIDVTMTQVLLAEKNVELIRIGLRECQLTAPIGGVVLAKNYEPGELLLPGSPVIKLGRLDKVHTWIYVPNNEVGKVHIGQNVKLVADTYPGRAFFGEVVLVNKEAEFTPKSIQTKEDRTRLVFGVKVSLGNKDGSLMPGMPVEAELIEDSAGTAAGR